MTTKFADAPVVETPAQQPNPTPDAAPSNIPADKAIELSGTFGDETPDSGAPASTDVAESEPVDSADQEAESEPLDESSIFPQEGETDFTDSVYQRAAEHYSKTFKVQLNPQDPAHRALLREVIQRGQSLSQLKSAATETQLDAPDEGDAESAPQPAAEPTSEDIQKFMSQVSEYAKSVVHPEIGHAWVMKFLTPLVDPQVLKSLTPQQTQGISHAFAEGGLHLLNTVLPQLMDNLVGGYLTKAYPELGSMHSDRVTESAFAELKQQKKDGKPLFPNIDQLRQSGAIEAVYQEYPHLRDAEFIVKGQRLPPKQAKVKELAMVLKLARGEAVSPELMKQAVQTGAKQVQQRQQMAAASKLATGESKGGFQKEESNIVTEMFGAPSHNKFAALVDKAFKK